MSYYFQFSHVLQSYTEIVCLIGLFGNLNLIIATCRHRSLRTKMGCLLMISTISHTVCLISELISVALKLRFRFTQIPRDECFRFVAVYMFAVLFQSTHFLMMAVDLFLAVFMPIRHKVWNRNLYILILCVPPLAFSTFAVIIEKMYVTHDLLLFCTVSMAIPKTLRFGGTFIVLSTVLLAVILISITAFKVRRNMKIVMPHFRSPRNHEIKPKRFELRLLKSLAALIFVFICSWCLPLLIFLISLYFDDTVTIQVQKYAFILVLPTFCQNFFVTALRSIRYRRAYLEQFVGLPVISFIIQNSNSETTLKKSNHQYFIEVRRTSSLPAKFV